MIYEVTLVFDDADVREERGEQPLSLDDVTMYAENLGRDLFSFKTMPGYTGFRVNVKEGISCEEFDALQTP